MEFLRTLLRRRFCQGLSGSLAKRRLFSQAPPAGNVWGIFKHTLTLKRIKVKKKKRKQREVLAVLWVPTEAYEL